MINSVIREVVSEKNRKSLGNTAEQYCRKFVLIDCKS